MLLDKNEEQNKKTEACRCLLLRSVSVPGCSKLRGLVLISLPAWQIFMLDCGRPLLRIAPQDNGQCLEKISFYFEASFQKRGTFL